MLKPDDQLPLPMTVDNFALTRRIGAGAMGEVFLASDVLTGRAIAIKVMSARLIGNVRAETRFRREIAAMGQLRHQGIPAFAGYGELPGGRPYLAMDYVAGHSLDAFVPEGRPLPEDLALWAVSQIAEVIGYCNRESGMIHRDLKPSNIMVDLAGQPGLCEQSKLRIIDFGLASYIDFGDWDDFSTGDYHRASGGTMAGEVMGTPHYMSPEQIRGEQLTFHSDIYALGAILFHLLTGHAPYPGTSAGVVMAAHLDSAVPDPSRSVAVRAATVAVVQRAMAKAVSARFRSYQQFIANLQAARFASGQATKRVTRGYSPAGEGTKQPSTSGTEVSHERPASAAWKRPDEPAQPPPPGSSGTTGWRRPSPTQQAPGQPSTASWKRPIETPRPETPALEPGTRPWMNPAIPKPPAKVEQTISDEFPTTPAALPRQISTDPPSSSRWRRPVRTPLPALASAASASEVLQAARVAIDAAHAADPEQLDGRPAELVYADAVEGWLLRLYPEADPILRLAARAQHLQRWTLPRAAYPMDRAGYHQWRTEQYRRQGALARRLCHEAGLAEGEAQRVEALVAKKLLAQSDGQAIEDAACLVFLTSEIAGFAAIHADYTPQQYIDILRKTMRKMSPAGREAALALSLPEPFAGLVQTAAASLRSDAPA